MTQFSGYSPGASSHQWEAALRRSDAKFAKAFSENPIITTISDFNDDDRLIEVNQAFEAVVGYSRDEAVGRTSKELGLWHDLEEFHEAVRQYRQKGNLRGYEYRFRTKTGEVRTGLISAAVTELDGVPYVLASTIDITGRKRVEEEKAALERELRQSQKMETVGRLAGGVAHDFNNLLMLINGYSEALVNSLPQASKDWNRAKQISQAGELAASLTRQLLTLSSNQSVQPRPLILNKIVSECEEMLVRLLGEDVRVIIALDPCLRYILADSDLIRQVLLNLAVNARDAMPGGGTLTVVTRNVDRDHPFVLLEVSDSGAGMSEEIVQQIFEPFFTTKEKGAGTGLGLAVVYGSIKQCGGWIDVSSTPGAGTSFRIYLPALGTPSTPSLKAVPRVAQRPAGGETILVVEDNEAVRDLVASVLESYGYAVMQASGSGQAFALAAAHAGEIHLMLTDLMLSGMNGNELSKRMLQLRPGMKVLFMSGYPADTLGDRLRVQNMSYITKPFRPAELEEKIREALNPEVFSAALPTGSKPYRYTTE